MFVIGNWKLNKTKKEALEFINEVNASVPSFGVVKSIICSPSLYLNCLNKHSNDNIKIGAQNMFYEDTGAYTGEISGMMLEDLGIEYVILGHSERRTIFKETDEDINKKILSALSHNIHPILCLGESLSEKENNKTIEVIENELSNDLKNVADISNVIIAYEPIWAIGTGLNCNVSDSETVIKHIKDYIYKMFSVDVPVLYGGSVKVNNFEDYIKGGIIDGALIGGASLDSKNFIDFTKIASKYSK